MIYFISDLHLNHKNVIEYSNRPFDNVEQMNQTILNNINETVKVDDYLYILGDFNFKSVKNSLDLIKSINCNNIIFTQGNHDQKRLIGRLSDIQDKNIIAYYINELPFIIYLNYKIYFAHFNNLKDSLLDNELYLHGHIHTEGNQIITKNKFYDVGVDNNNFKPVELNDILKII